MDTIRMIAYFLVVLGAILWGVVGIFNYDLISSIFGNASIMSRIIFSLVGVAGVTLLAIPREDECYCDCTETHMN
jgi:uncharacterized membrane protein YuzA (DUF378 family)